MSRTILMRNYCQAACHPCTSPKTYKQKAVGVSILGAHTPTGEALAFLLKHNPLVSRIHLYGKRKVFGITIDLQHMDTRCRVTGHFGAKGLPASLRSADIILMLPETPEVPLDAPLKEHLKDQGKRVIELAEACSRYAPKAILTVCVPPISMTVPLVAFVFRRTPWYHPGRIIGSVALAQVQINSLTARFQGLDPTSVHVPLVGGPDIDTLVPLFSRAAPVGVSRGDAYRLLKQYRGTDEEVSMSKSAFTSPPLSTAYSLNQMVTTMALGLCGDPDAIGCAFVRTNVVPTCTHLVSTVRYSHGGVVHNYGIPKLTNMEFHIFHSACLVLKKREEAALDFLTHKDESPCKRSSRESQECSTVSN